MAISFILGIDKNVVQVYNNKDIKLFLQNLINIALEYSWYISQAKKHYIIPNIDIASLENRFAFITFSDPHLIVSIGKVELGEMLGPSKSIK